MILFVVYACRKLKGSGTAFLTDRRIVLIRSGSVKSHHGYSSFELPLVRDSWCVHRLFFCSCVVLL